MNVKKRGAVQVNRALRGEVTFGFAARGTKKKKGRGGVGESGRSKGRTNGVKKEEGKNIEQDKRKTKGYKR